VAKKDYGYLLGVLAAQFLLSTCSRPGALSNLKSKEWANRQKLAGENSYNLQ